MPKTKLLIISHLFPPQGGIAVQRVLSFVRYLPAEECEIHVLTARNAAGPITDHSLVRLVPNTVRVHHALMPGLPYGLRQRLRHRIAGSRNSARPAAPSPASDQPASPWRKLAGTLFCPDAEVPWIPFAIAKARRIVAKHGIDTVLVSAPPFSSFVVGNHLKRRHPELKLISDFRDEWLDFYYNTFAFYKSASTFRRAETIERATVALSDAVLTVTESNRRTMKRRYPETPSAKFVHLPNGYDPEVFRNFTPRPHEPGKVIVTHVGTVYQTSSPRFFLDALDALPAALRDRVEVRFIGRITGTERHVFENREANIKLLGFMPQAEAFRQAETTDYLLLTMTDPNFASGKIYEYLAMGKPILALSPPGGEVDRVLRETGAGWCADPGDANAVRAMLLGAFQDEAAKPLSNTEAIRQYERPRLTARLDHLIRRTPPASASG